MVVIAIVNDMQSIVDFIKSLYPSASVIKQNTPSSPIANTFVVRLLSSSSDSETVFHMRRDREYQLVYYGTNSSDALTKMDEIERKTIGDMVIPIKGSLRYIRVEGFSFSMPFKTESGVDVVIGILQTEIREARDQKTYDKIMQVYARYEM